MAEVMQSGRFILGPACERFEEAFARVCQVPYAVGCASGSDALLLALMACDVGAGDEVILPTFTFFATASAVVRLGARPVFVDIDPASFNLDTGAAARAVTMRTKAILPVHLFGHPVPLDPLHDLSAARDLAIVEDCAQALGATCGNRPVGSVGRLGCFSFYPTKNLGGCGDGGLITTSDEQLARRLRRLRAHGMEPRYFHQEVGINSRLDSLQAAVLRVKLAHLAGWNAARTARARRYRELFDARGLSTMLTVPSETPIGQHAWNQFTIRVHHGRRDALRSFLSECGIGTEVYYPLPLHLQSCFQGLGYGRGDFPHAELAADEVLSLPMFPTLTEREQSTVVGRIAEFFASKPWITAGR